MDADEYALVAALMELNEEMRVIAVATMIKMSMSSGDQVPVICST